MLRLRSRRLSVEFLVLTVPAIALAALVFFIALAAYKRDELSRAVFEDMRKDAWRDAAVLTTPLWNLDGPVIDSILRASARAQKATGVPISTHTWAAGRTGEMQQAIFAQEGVDLGRVLGFVYDGDGENIRVRPLQRDGLTATLEISHFSGAGAATANVNDYAASVQVFAVKGRP